MNESLRNLSIVPDICGRELAAMIAMHAFLARVDSKGASSDLLAEASVEMADALYDKLEGLKE
jgi:hypothetical protein